MNDKVGAFTDPKGIYTIMIPPNFIHEEIEINQERSMHQFKAIDGSIFRISCLTLDEKYLRIVEKENLVPHDFSLPNISFIEKFHKLDTCEVYVWMALIDDSLFVANYEYVLNDIDKNLLGLELFGLRMALRFINVHRSRTSDKDAVGKAADSLHKDYDDIINWRNSPQKFFDSIGKDSVDRSVKCRGLKIDPVKLYALLTSKISTQPNGYFDLMRIALPLDNIIWWDFVLECEKGFIQIWRTPHVLEAKYFFETDLDLELFFNGNIERYQKEITQAINVFEKHSIYINHYESYRQCVNTLWSEISQIDLSVPEAPKIHHVTKENAENYTREVETFINNSIKYHALAKSLVLNAAFKIESFLNLIIRIGALPELRSYPDVLSKFTKQEFQYRVKNIRFYTCILNTDIDVSGDVYRDAKELMTLRNKYVHYDEDKIFNKLGEIYYDRNYPLLPIEENRPAINATIKTYHQPDIVTVKKAYDVSNNFICMIESLFNPEVKESLIFLIQQNPIGYNESKSVYSSVYMPTALDFFTGSNEYE